MDEAQQPAAAAPLSNQPAAADLEAAPAAAPAAALSSPTPAVDAAPIHSRPWMEADGEDDPLPADPPGPRGQEQRGSRSQLQPAAAILSAAVRPAAAPGAAVSAPLPARRAAHAEGGQQPAAAAAAAAASDSTTAARARARAAPHGHAQQTALPAKRPREEADLDETQHARDELQRQRWQREQSSRAASAASASARRSRPSGPAASAAAATVPPLFSELPQLCPGHRTDALRADALPQEWFVDSVPGELICGVCTDVARDPPNLEACGQSQTLAPQRQLAGPMSVCRAQSAHVCIRSLVSLSIVQVTPFAASVWRSTDADRRTVRSAASRSRIQSSPRSPSCSRWCGGCACDACSTTRAAAGRVRWARR